MIRIIIITFLLFMLFDVNCNLGYITTMATIMGTHKLIFEEGGQTGTKFQNTRLKT